MQTNNISAEPSAASFKEKLAILFIFLRLGCLSFGGPIAHVGYFRQAFVENKKWLSEQRFAELLAICHFLPGPASSQLGFSIGLLRGGFTGAVFAFIGFTLPSAILLVLFVPALGALSTSISTPLIHGLKIVALVVVADALIGMTKNICTDNKRKVIAIVTTCIALIAPFAAVQLSLIILAGAAGFFLLETTKQSTVLEQPLFYGKRLGSVFFVLTGLLALVVFGLPEPLQTLTQPFYYAGLTVFGGGHVVLPLLDQSLVQTGLVTSSEFLAGYGASQAIPGPMFSFAAYLGALLSGEFSPWLGAVTALIFMFLPGLLLMLAILPFWQSIKTYPVANRILAGINAAVVGLLAAVFFDPIYASAIVNNTDLVIALLGVILLSVWRISPLWLVLWSCSSSILLFGY